MGIPQPTSPWIAMYNIMHIFVYMLHFLFLYYC